VIEPLDRGFRPYLRPETLLRRVLSLDDRGHGGDGLKSRASPTGSRRSRSCSRTSPGGGATNHPHPRGASLAACTRYPPTNAMPDPQEGCPASSPADIDAISDLESSNTRSSKIGHLGLVRAPRDDAPDRARRVRGYGYAADCNKGSRRRRSVDDPRSLDLPRPGARVSCTRRLGPRGFRATGLLISTALHLHDGLR